MSFGIIVDSIVLRLLPSRVMHVLGMFSEVETSCSSHIRMKGFGRPQGFLWDESCLSLAHVSEVCSS